ncbi:hypothetical protein MNV49_004518 [Pseudohyphozyma bogoriensis]|nr:hypothetical protein MNV49_004518 [Pseudohyphozyma bogoriensis]
MSDYELAPIRRPTKTYGKRSLAKRDVPAPPAAVARGPRAGSDTSDMSDDDDDEVQRSLATKLKGKEKAMACVEKEDKVVGGSKVGAMAKSLGGKARRAATVTTASVVGGMKGKSDAAKGKGRDTTDWDEDAVMRSYDGAGAGAEAGASTRNRTREGSAKPTTTLTKARSAPSPSTITTKSSPRPRSPVLRRVPTPTPAPSRTLSTSTSPTTSRNKSISTASGTSTSTARPSLSPGKPSPSKNATLNGSTSTSPAKSKAPAAASLHKAAPRAVETEQDAREFSERTLSRQVLNPFPPPPFHLQTSIPTELPSARIGVDVAPTTSFACSCPDFSGQGPHLPLHAFSRTVLPLHLLLSQKELQASFQDTNGRKHGWQNSETLRHFSRLFPAHLSSPSASRSPSVSPEKRKADLGPSSSLPILSPSASPTKKLARTCSAAASGSMVVLGSGVEALGRVAAGAKKTYGGARSFRQDDGLLSLVVPAPSRAAPADGTPATTSRVKPELHASSTPSTGTSFSRRHLLPLQRERERERYDTLRSKWGIDVEEEEGLESSEHELKSIIQLREKGGEKKFRDEFDWLVDGLSDGGSVGVRRTSAIEVLRKVEDSEFVRKLKAAGLVERVYAEFRKAEAGDGDKVLDPALAFLVAFLVRDQRMAEQLVRASGDAGVGEGGVLVVLSSILERDGSSQEITSEGKKGNKAELRAITSIRQIIDRSELLKEDDLPVTSRVLCLFAISLIASFAPRPVFRPQELVCSSGAFDAVIAALTSECAGIPQRLMAYENGLDLLPPDGSIHLRLVDIIFGIIEACSAGTASTHEILSSHIADLVPILSNLVLTCHLLLLSDSTAASPVDMKTRSAAMEVLLSSLRLVVELTTVNPEWSVAVAEQDGFVSALVRIIVATRSHPEDSSKFEVVPSSDAVMPDSDLADVKDEEDGAGSTTSASKAKKEAAVTAKFDLLCLALGVLANVMEMVPSVKDTLGDFQIDPKCGEHRRCMRSCQCGGRESALLRLVDLYIDPLDDSLNEANTDFVKGYSGMVVGLSMLDSPRNQDLVIEALSSRPEAMEQMLVAIEELASLTEAADRAAAEERDPEEDSQNTALEDDEDVEMVKRQSEGAVRLRNMVDAVRARVG